ncbi:MAG: hypothetical protein V2J07_10000 [Anaerolineae bacterium]|jgi:hypothetical protein|nr:hypothetical protein [Anaerolineae bacterium]
MDFHQHNIQWLLDNGSPAIRLRTHRDLLDEVPSQDMVDDLLNFSMTQQWMARLQPEPNFMNLHGSTANCLENVCGKLHELGFAVHMSPVFSAQLQPFIDFLQDTGRENLLSEFATLFTYAPLMTIGVDNSLFLDMAVDHLKRVGDFCRTMNFDIYIDPDTFGGMYSQYKGRKLLNPETNHRLPTIWDLYLLAYMPRIGHEKEIQQAESAIINYILTDDYQHLPEGYGIMVDPQNRKYYAHGWNVYLPGWFDLRFSHPFQEASFVQRLELLSNFRQARSRKWLQESLAHLLSFQTENGTYRLPPSYLKEGTAGYFVTGTYLRLEDDRRRRIALDLDSTFRIEHLLKLNAD